MGADLSDDRRSTEVSPRVGKQDGDTAQEAWGRPNCVQTMERESQIILGGPDGFHWDQWVEVSRRWILVQILKGKLCKSRGCPERQGSWSPVASPALVGPL